MIATSFWSPSKEEKEKPRRYERMLGLKGVSECQQQLSLLKLI